MDFRLLNYQLGHEKEAVGLLARIDRHEIVQIHELVHILLTNTNLKSNQGWNDPPWLPSRWHFCLNDHILLIYICLYMSIWTIIWIIILLFSQIILQNISCFHSFAYQSPVKKASSSSSSSSSSSPFPLSSPRRCLQIQGADLGVWFFEWRNPPFGGWIEQTKHLGWLENN